MWYARLRLRSVKVVTLLMSVTLLLPIGGALGADPPREAPKLMFQAPKGWKPTTLSDSVLIYNAPDLKKGEECRVTVFSRTDDRTFEEWFAQVQGTDVAVEESKLVEGKTKGGYQTLRRARVVKNPPPVHRLYYALREGKRYALIAGTASTAELLKTAEKQAEAIADSWDYSGDFPSSRMLTVGAYVVRVRFPAQDVTLAYVERAGGFTVELEAKDAAIEGKKFYIGDGSVALDLVADPSAGIFLQGVNYKSGDQFKKGSTIKVRPGYKKASDLKPGDVYVTLPGVTFELPAK